MKRACDMGWIELSTLPGQKLDSKEHGFNYWRIENGSVWHQGRRLRRADPETFEIRSDYEQVFIARDKDYVYHAWSLVSKIDRDSFKDAGGGYWVDLNRAYCEYETSIRPLKGDDARQFTYLGGPYARDSAFAYYAGRVMKTCTNPMLLHLVVDSDCWYASDKTRVYHDGAELRGADFTTWTHVEGGFSRDLNSVYFGSKKLPGVKVASWRIIADNYSRDERSVYNCCFKLKGVNPDEWQSLQHGYSTDQRNVYYGSSQIVGAEPQTFEVTGEGTAKDKHHTYEGSRHTNA